MKSSVARIYVSAEYLKFEETFSIFDLTPCGQWWTMSFVYVNAYVFVGFPALCLQLCKCVLPVFPRNCGLLNRQWSAEQTIVCWTNNSLLNSQKRLWGNPLQLCCSMNLQIMKVPGAGFYIHYFTQNNGLWLSGLLPNWNECSVCPIIMWPV